MTKRNLLLVSLLVVFGLGAMVPAALAQAPTQGEGTVVSVSSSLYTLRPNSIGDAMGPVFLNYASGYGIIAGGETFTITYSQPIVGASDFNTFYSENPTQATKDVCDDTYAVGIAGVFCSSMFIYASGNTLTLTNGSTAVEYWGPAVHGPSYITIWGLRADSVGIPGGTIINATVGAALNQQYPITFSSSGSIVSYPVNVGQIAPLATGTITATMYPTDVLSCIGYSSEFTGFDIYMSENWAGAWTALSDELRVAPFGPTPSNNYFVTNGSEISITLTGIPPGVKITPGTPQVDNGGFQETWGPIPPPFTASAGNTTVTFEFSLTRTDPTAQEASDIQFDISSPATLPPNTPPIVATVMLNPTTPTSYFPAFTYPVGALVAEPSSPFDAVTFIGCQTNLLFPYVTNYTTGASGGAEGNWDTALEIANTTSDPFNYSSDIWNYGTDSLWPAGATPQSGSCSFWVYAAPSSPTPAAATPTFTTGIVPSGGIWATLLSNTAAKGTAGGYAIATCNFLNAVGYAETLNNFGLGNPQVLGSYLAYVIPNPFWVPRTVDAVVGQFAISHTCEFGYEQCGYYEDGVLAGGSSSKTKANLRKYHSPAGNGNK